MEKMSMGLRNGPSSFQFLMDSVLRNLKWSTVMVYLDDLIVVGRTWSDHLTNLRLYLIG